LNREREGAMKKGKGKTGSKRAVKSAKRAKAKGKAPTRRGNRPVRTSGDVGEPAGTMEFLEERLAHTESTPLLTGGDLDADWQRAGSSGEEAEGGSGAPPYQVIGEEIGRALGVEQGATSPVLSSAEILRDRDRRRWELERRAERGSRPR
jgi:hypothetical protein